MNINNRIGLYVGATRRRAWTRYETTVCRHRMITLEILLQFKRGVDLIYSVI